MGDIPVNEQREGRVIRLDPKWVAEFLEDLDEKTRPAMRRMDREEAGGFVPDDPST